MKIMTIVGTRPEIIRLSEVIKVLDNCSNHVLVHTGQNYDYELNEIFFKDLDLRDPNYFLEAAGKSSCDTVGAVISKSYDLMKKEMPDAVLVLGDTNSCMSVYSAKRLKIPTFHMEAGNRCFDQRVPEEINRRLVDHIADINLPYSEPAKLNLLREGLPSDLVLKTGSPMKEVLGSQIKKIKKSQILSSMNIKKDHFFLVSLHREENVNNSKRFLAFIEMLNGLAKNYKIPVIVSTHPRTRNELDKINIEINPLIEFLKPLSFSDYNSLQVNSKVVLSDSGTISEESAILGFKAINLRDTHERPEAMEFGIVPFVKPELKNIITAINLIENTHHNSNFNNCLVPDYDIDNCSKTVAKIILSYPSYIQRVIWGNKSD